MTSRRYAIIIGAMKSGTTTLFDALARHPKIAPATNKEPGFFAFDEIYARGWDWFDGLFDFDEDEHDWRLEASTDYTKAPFVDGVWNRMTADPAVEIRLIYIMRHPFRRIESHARHVQAGGKEVGQKISPIVNHSLEQGFSPVNLAVSQYSRQLRSFEAARTEGRLHWLTLEHLKSEPRQAMNEIYRFLDLEPPTCADTHLPKSNTAEGKTKEHPLWKYVGRSGPLLQAAKLLLPKSVRDNIKSRFRSPVRTDGRFELTESEERLLFNFYASELQCLSEKYGVDVETNWNLPLK